MEKYIKQHAVLAAFNLINNNLIGQCDDLIMLVTKDNYISQNMDKYFIEIIKLFKIFLRSSHFSIDGLEYNRKVDFLI